MVIRKYTPPTCTLEIKAKESPLSRWAGQPVLKQLRFELCFDDPRQPEEKRVTIWGDRTELEALYEVVTTYVQDFLSQSPALMPVASLESAIRTSLPLARSKGAEENPELLSLHRSSTLALLQNSPPNLYLQPRGILTHDLFLGPLETEISGPFVSLSALQLFDLATALDEYAAEVVALPQLKRPIWRQAPPPWTKAAAMVLVTVGVTTAAIKLLDRVGGDSKKTALSPSPASSPVKQTPVVAQVSPLPTPPAAIPIPPPPIATTPVPTPLPGISGRLSPPPPVIPPPPPHTGSQPSHGSQPIIVIPETGTTPPPSNSSPRLSSLPPPSNSSPSLSSLPPPSNSSPSLSSSPPPSSLSPVLIPRTSPTQSSSSKAPVKHESAPRQQPQVAKAQEQPAASPAPAPVPTIAQLPYPPTLSRSRPQSAPRASLPQLDASPPISPVPEDSRQPTYSSASRPAPSSTNMSQNQSLQAGGAATSNSAAKDRLFDIIPQVAEIRNYFQQRWKPPSELTQPLEYNLVLNGNGSIDRIIPLGSGAATYLNLTNMPTPGQPFVSTFDRGSAPTIRLVLYPDGRVETFLAPTK